MNVIYNNIVTIELSNGMYYRVQMPKEEYVKLTELLDSHDHIKIIHDDGEEYLFYKQYISLISFRPESTVAAKRGRVFI